MAELVDALDLGSSALKHAGSSPAIRNNTDYIKKRIAGMKGIEPLLLVLETNVLPLNYTP
jgi:hypothetical protein